MRLEPVSLQFFLFCYRDSFTKLLTASNAAFSIRHENKTPTTTTRRAPTGIADAPISPGDDVGSGRGDNGGAPTAGTGTLVAGALCPFLHHATSSPVPTADAATLMHLVPLKDNRRTRNNYRFFGCFESGAVPTRQRVQVLCGLECQKRLW